MVGMGKSIMVLPLDSENPVLVIQGFASYLNEFIRLRKYQKYISDRRHFEMYEAIKSMINALIYLCILLMLLNRLNQLPSGVPSMFLLLLFDMLKVTK